VLDTPELILPHPRMLNRRFVLQPLSEIRSELILPNQTQKIREILASLQDTSEVRLFSEKLR
jgi:2-amino-4-hydroxy-6-hydroxymethyldihydropteridine diphosphokinase